MLVGGHLARNGRHNWLTAFTPLDRTFFLLRGCTLTRNLGSGELKGILLHGSGQYLRSNALALLRRKKQLAPGGMFQVILAPGGLHDAFPGVTQRAKQQMLNFVRRNMSQNQPRWDMMLPGQLLDAGGRKCRQRS